MKARDAGTIGVVAIIVAVVGILVPIAWDQYKSRIALELRVLPPVVVERDTAFAQLRMFYRNQPISRVTKLRFALANSGRAPIRSDVVVTFPWIALRDSVRILDVTVDRRIPRELSFETRLDTVQRRVSLVFPLMNRHDRAEFSVLVQGARPPIEVGARIVGLNGLTVVEQTETDPRGSRPKGTAFYVIAIVTAFSVLLFLLAIVIVSNETEVRDLFVNGKLVWPTGGRRNDYDDFMKSVFSTKSQAELREVKQLVAAIPENQGATAPQDEALRAAVTRMAYSVREARLMAITFGIMSTIGIWYTLRALL